MFGHVITLPMAHKKCFLLNSASNQEKQMYSVANFQLANRQTPDILILVGILKKNNARQKSFFPISVKTMTNYSQVFCYILYIILYFFMFPTSHFNVELKWCTLPMIIFFCLYSLQVFIISNFIFGLVFIYLQKKTRGFHVP